jgi:DNA-binding NarL/FixJ family response regulator
MQDVVGRNERLDTSRRLTKRHEEILSLLFKGLRNAEIGEQLGLSARTVKSYLNQMFLIFDVSNRTELVGLFASKGLDDSGRLIEHARR